MTTKRGRKPKIPESERPGWAGRIHQARVNAGYKSQKALADDLGGPQQQTVGGWEGGTSEPDIATFERLAEKLRVSAAWLAFGSGSPEDGQPALIPAMSSKKEERRLVSAIGAVAKMLDEEGVGADLRFLLALGRKVALSAKDVEDDLHAQQIIRDAIEAERQEIRRGLDDLKNGRL